MPAVVSAGCRKNAQLSEQSRAQGLNTPRCTTVGLNGLPPPPAGSWHLTAAPLSCLPVNAMCLGWQANFLADVKKQQSKVRLGTRTNSPQLGQSVE